MLGGEVSALHALDDDAAHVRSHKPQQAKDDEDGRDGPVDHKAQDDSEHVQRNHGVDNPRLVHEREANEQQHSQANHYGVVKRGPQRAVVKLVQKWQRQHEGEQLHGQRAGHHHPAKLLERVFDRCLAETERTDFRFRHLVAVGAAGLTHAGSFPNIARASPAVTTEPVMTIPEPD